MKATASFHGATADEALSAAVRAFDDYFGEGRYQIVSSNARPLLVDGAGRVKTWDVEFEAEGAA